MRSGRWILSAAALALLAWLVHRHDALGSGPRWTQQQIEQKMVESAQAMRTNVQGWNVAATAAFQEDYLRLLNRSKPEWGEAIAPLTYLAEARQPKGPARVRARFTPGGRLIEWECISCGRLAREAVPPASVLSLLADGRDSEFNLKESSEGDSYWRWVWAPGEQTGLPLEARVTLDGGRVRKAVLNLPLRDSQREALRPSWYRLWSVTRVTAEVFGVLALIAAGLIIAWRMMGRRDIWRLAAGLALLTAAVFLTALAVEGWSWHTGEVLRDAGTRSRGSWVSRFLLIQPWRWVLAACAGLLVLEASQARKWIGFGHAFLRWKLCRRTGEELLSGLAWGPLLALPAYLLAGVCGPVWGELSPRLPFEANPVWAALPRTLGLAADLILFYGFIWPVAHRWVAGRRARAVVLASAGTLLFAGMGHHLPLSAWGGVSTGLLTGVVSWLVFRQAGMMGLLGSWIGAAAAGALAWLAAAPGMHAAAAGLSLASAAGIAAGAGYLSSLPSRTEDADLESELLRRNQAAGDVLGERVRLQAEFSEARQAQQGMLPSRVPAIHGFSVAAACRPAREVGGDLYDFLSFPDGTTGFCVADVSGKGMPAALYMTMTKGLLASAQNSAGELKPLVEALNGPLQEAGRRRTFVTLALARLDPDSAEVELVRAGHNPPLWRRAAQDECVYLMPKGTGLGLANRQIFARTLEAERVVMAPGDALLLYSDGLTEAMNARQEQFGEDRLAGIVRQSDGLDAEGLMKRILDAVDEFVGGAEAHDDLTLVVVRYGEQRGK